jgi:hypothetical protein
MQLGETIATYDVAMALRGESGKFDVTSPTGEIYHVTCKPVPTISSLEWSGNGTAHQPFLVQKVAEPVSPEQSKDSGKEPAKPVTSGTAENGIPASAGQTPFLIDNQEETKAANSDRLAPSHKISSPGISEDKSDNLEVADFDLLYLESDPKTSRPSACICLKNGQPGNTQKSMTPVCGSFIEFDAEVRRLHAQLDEIRSRARKQFYKAYASAASA